MINNEQQLSVAKEKLEQLILAQNQEPSSEIPEFLHLARNGQMHSIIEELTAEIKEYKSRTSTRS